MAHSLFRRSWTTLLALLAGVLVVGVALAPHLVRAVHPDPVTAAWAQARAAGSYHFTGDVTQVTIPSATISNVGRSGRTETMHLEGLNDRRADTLEMQLWSDGGSVLQAGSATAMRVEHGKTYVREGAGAWTQRDDVSPDGLAPQGDFLAYLGAIKGVTAHAPETRGGIAFTRYSFALDGPAFAASMRDQLQQALRAKNALPPGQSLDVPHYYRDMTGEGELWVGSDGLPIRQVMQLAFPEQRGERVNAQLTITFSQFGTPIATGVLGALVALGEQLPSASLPASVLLALATMLVLVRFRHSRRVQKVLAATMIASLVLGPVLSNAKTRSFLEAQSAQAATQDKQRQEASAARDMQAALGQPSFDPHQSPLAAATGDVAQAADSRAQQAATGQSPIAVSQSASGAAQAQPAAPADNGADTDKDGLTDFQEQRVGTDYAFADSDEDSIPDGVEVRGFQLGGKTWYANPNDADSNGDGLGDTIERDANNDGAPDDTNGNGVPDLFDFDNDGDGVPDAKDLAPFSVNGATTPFAEGNPLKLTVRNLAAGKPSFVDFQVRPKNTKHLWFAFNVLDWPSDSEGQIRDVDGKTYADVGTASAGAPAIASEPYGDTKLIPMLEIRVPNGGANLPPQRDLVPFGISVNNFTADGSTKVAYVPLNIVTDEKTGQRVAFNGHMRYAPTGNWAAQDVRLVWTVQALVDVPCDASDAAATAAGCASDNYFHNTPQVVQTYYDDWTLTGLNVTEDNGTSVATIYEDPAADANLKDDAALVALSHGLDNSFLAGRDQDNNGQRDVEIAEIVRRFDRTANASVPAVQRWAIPNALRAERKDYTTLDQAMASTTMTETKRVLDTQFAPRWQRDRTLKPLLMYAQEQRSRGLGLDGARASGGYVAQSGSALTFDLQPAGQVKVPLDVMASLKWTPYCGTGSAPAWAACAPDAYWDEVGARYSAGSVDGDPADPTLTEGRLVATQLYFTTLAGGSSRIVQSEQRLASPLYSRKTDTELERDVRIYTGTAATAVKSLASHFVQARYVDGVGVLKYLKNQFTSFRAGSNGQTIKDAVDILKQFRSGGHINRLVGTAIVSGVALIVGTLLTGAILKYFTSDPNTQLAGNIIIKVAVTAVTLYLSVYKPLDSVKSWVSAYQAAGQKLSAFSSIGTSAIKGSIVGAVIVGVITWGLFVYTIVSGNVSAFSPEFNKALAETVAASLLLYLTVVLSATVIGTVIVAIVALIDAILTAICELGVDALRTVPGLGGACFTLNTSAVKVLSYLLYNYDLMVDTARDDLVVPGVPRVQLADPNKGYVAGNALSVTMPVTTTIRHKDPDPSNGLYINLYLYLFSPANLRSSTFKYSLTRPNKQDLGVTRDEMASAWQNVVEDHKYVLTPMYRGQASTRVGLNNVQLPAGLNRTLDFNLNMGYALPAYECWPLPHPLVFFGVPPIPICYTREFVGNNATAFDTIKFDILPATLDGFMALGSKGTGQGLAWDAAFPALADADGDGLLGGARNGLDPNDATADADGDGLSDGNELERRSNGVAFSPTAADTDGDGLTDLEEMRAGSDPARADGDGDGLTDKQEVEGWDVTINGATPLTVRVTSDPRRADTDGDGVGDQAERELALDPNPASRIDINGFPFHPQVVNPSLLDVYVSVDDPDRFVAPDQRVLYNTTIVTTVPFASGQLKVQTPNNNVPPYVLNLATPGTVEQQTAFRIAAGTPTQLVPFTSRVDAKRTPASSTTVVQAGLKLVVDNDKPTASVSSLRNGQYIKSGEALIIGGNAADPTSPISKVELSTLSVSGGAPGGTATGTASWTYPLVMNEGRAEIRARATDAVGNVGAYSPIITVYGDPSPPEVSLSNQPATGSVATRTASGQWRIRLGGTATDPVLRDQTPGSGVASVEVNLVKAVNGASAVYDEAHWQRATVSGNTWSIDYAVYPDQVEGTPTGLYFVYMRAADKVGNLRNPFSRDALVDVAGPQATLTKTDISTSVLTSTISSAVTMGGVITETGDAGIDRLEASFAPLSEVVPIPDRLLDLDFDERAGAASFADSSGNFNTAFCLGATCPSAGVAGRTDKGLAFTQTSGAVEVPTNPTIEFSASETPRRSFSVQGWVKLGPETTTGFPLVDKLNTTFPASGYKLAINAQGYATWSVQAAQAGSLVTLAGNRDLRDNQWHYLAGSYNRLNGRAYFYVDGALVNNLPAPNGFYSGGLQSLRIGPAVGNGTVTVDKVTIFGRALSLAEVQALYKSGGRLWHPATLAQRGDRVLNSSWTLPVPANLEDIYQVDLRASDMYGNRQPSGNAWRGIIDTLAPRVSFSGRATGESYLDPATNTRRYAVAYTCAAEDGFLAEKSFECPGNAAQPPVHTYNSDPIRKQLFPDSSQLIKLANTYTVWQDTAQPSGSAKACDLFGHCATATATAQAATAAAASADAATTADEGGAALTADAPPNAAAKRPHATIVTPMNGGYVASTGQVAVTVVAEAAKGLKEIALSLDGAVVATLPLTREAAIALDQHTFVVAVAGAGEHTLTASASDWDGNIQKKAATVRFTLDTQPPTVTIANATETLSDTYTLGSGVLRFRGVATDDVGVDAVQVRVDDMPFADAEFGNGEWHIAYPLGDPEGKTLHVTVRAIDRAGQISEVQQDIAVDLSEANPPDTTISAGPSNPSNDTAASFSFTGVPGAHDASAFACQLDDGHFTPCASPASFTNLSKGSHTFRVRAVDALGFVDPSPASATWTVNAGQPDATIADKPANPSTGRAASFTFVGDGSATSFECALDGGSFTPCASPQPYSGLADGSHTFQVRAKDATGKAGPPDRYAWRVVNAAPVALDQTATISGTAATAITLGATDEDALAYHVVGPPAHGVLLGSAPNLVYEPDTGFIGSDSFTFRADDGEHESNLATVTINVQPSTQARLSLSSFVVLGQETVTIKANSQVLSGNVAANTGGTDRGVRVGEDVTFRSADSHVLGDSIVVEEGAAIYNPGYNQLRSSGSVLGTRTTPLALPVVADLPPLPPVTPGTQVVEVKDGASATLEAGSYGTLTVRERGTLILSGGVYHFQSWRIGERAQVKFLAPSEIRIADGLVLGSGIYLGPADGSGISAKDIVIYVGGQADKDSPSDDRQDAAADAVLQRAERERSERATVVATILVPNGTLRLYEHTDATGAFIAKRVIIGADVTLTLDSYFTGRTGEHGGDGAKGQVTEVRAPTTTYQAYLPLVGR